MPDAQEAATALARLASAGLVEVRHAGYDSASRLVSTSGGNGSAWRYDAFGRTTAMPTPDGSGVASTSYFVNDLVAAQEVPGVEKAAWSLDPLQRFSTQETFAWVNGAWANSTEQVIHYDGDGDEPGWIVEDATQPDKVTRWVEGADGQVAVQTGKTGEQVLQLVDLHGDVVGTVPIGDGAPVPSQRDLRFVSYDEFGNPQPLSGGATSNAPPRYGWLGAAQRSSDTPAGVVLMGVRLYHPGIGRFLQVDPVAGGSANAYDYCNADPVNCTDLGGTIAWGKVLGAVATVGEIASVIPGPIGAAAAGVSAVAYVASGNKGKALLMGVTAAAALVGAGAAVTIGVRAVSRARGIVRAARAGQEVATAAKPVSRLTARLAGRMWVGRGARWHGAGNNRALYSRDMSRRYRPAVDKSDGHRKANLELTQTPGTARGAWRHPRRLLDIHVYVKRWRS